jgi:uncharacterized lipoprotein YmbA
MAASAAFAGCVQLTRPAPHVQAYTLDYPAPAPAGKHLPVTLHVGPFGVAALYDRETIVYRETPVTTGTYFYHRWAANPGHMIADLLARDLADAEVYTAVYRTPALGGADYDVTGEVERLEEAPAAQGCVAALRLRITVARARSRASTGAVSQRAFAAEEPCTCADVPTVVEAMSRALATVSAQIDADLYDVISRDFRSH